MASRMINNPINIPYPFATTFGGTGLSEPEANGIMVANGASPMTPIVLETGQVLLGVTGSAPVPTTLTPTLWGITIDPAGPTVDMLPFVTYVTTETVIGDIITFRVPDPADVNVGDEFRVCCYGVDAIGFNLHAFNDADGAPDSFWQGYDQTVTIPKRSTKIKAVVGANGTPIVASIHIICVANDPDPEVPQYIVLSATGTFSIDS